MPRKVLIAIPEAMLQEADTVAQKEHRTRSDLIREALRRYLSHAQRPLSPPLTLASREG
jgi:metal-responsive CopG/Arc/MetJ family transcriptional regulator